ncbi:hypothetical protein NL449_27675, partial [Klebsiella pneumoniae]|nr:hypothetical protein [Klebsiella pneumoniae]
AWQNEQIKVDFLNDYNQFSQQAIKEKSLGRSKGGITVFVKNNLQCVLIDKCDWWIAFEVTQGKNKSLIIFVYFSPSNEINEYLGFLSEL